MASTSFENEPMRVLNIWPALAQAEYCAISFPYLCDVNPCLAELVIVEASHYNYQSDRGRCDPSPAGSTRASTMLGVQVSPKARHWFTTFRAYKLPTSARHGHAEKYTAANVR